MKNKYLLALIYVIVFWFSLQPAIDPDTGWHIATGKYIVENNHIPQTDPFSYSLPDHPYIAHSWASDTISYILVSQFGVISLSVIYALISTLTLFIIGSISSSISPHPSIHYLIPIIAFPAIEIIGQRPQAFSVLGTSLLLYLLIKKGKRYVWQIPLLFLVWTNLHGGVILGLGILLLWWIQEMITKSSGKNILTLSQVLVASTLATLINPYSYKVFTFAIGMVTNNISFIYNTDWVPLFSPLLGADTVLLRVVIIVSSVLAIIDNKSHRNLRVLSILFVLLSLKSIRFLVPLLVVVSPLVLQTLSRAFKGLSNHKLLPFLPVVLVGVFMFQPLVGKYDLACSMDEQCYAILSQMPYTAVKYIRQENISGNIFDFYTWGGYLSWQLPDSKVFIDGRMDNFFISGSSFLAEFVYIHQMRDGWYEKLISFDTEYVLIPISWSDHADFLEGIGWKTLITDNLSVFMKRPS